MKVFVANRPPPCKRAPECVKAAPGYFSKAEREAVFGPSLLSGLRDTPESLAALRLAIMATGDMPKEDYPITASDFREAEREPMRRRWDLNDRNRKSTHGARAWRQTYGGDQWFPLDPRPGDFAIQDIAPGLSLLCRYGGSCRFFYSVAEHSILCSSFGDPAFARRRLMHDAAEAVLGFDLAGPLKNHPAFAFIKPIEHAIEEALWEQFDIREPGDYKAIDTRMLLDERKVLFGKPPDVWEVAKLGLEPLGAPVLGTSSRLVEDLFMQRFEELFPEYTGP